MTFDILAAFFVGVMCGMGIGGGGLFVIYLTLARGMGQLDAQGVNLAFFIFASAAALLVHAAGRKLILPYIIVSLIFALPGAFLGSLTAAVISPSYVRRLFGIMLIFAGASTLIRQFLAFLRRRRGG